MKHMFFFIVLLLALPWKSDGQSSDHTDKFCDSICIHYGALVKNELLDINLILKYSMMSIFKVDSKPSYAPENILMYETNNKDTIDFLFFCIKSIVNNPPICRTNFVIDDCCDDITITVYEKDNECTYRYTNYRENYFPFAYTELYCFIQHLLVKYRLKDNNRTNANKDNSNGG